MASHTSIVSYPAENPASNNSAAVLAQVLDGLAEAGFTTLRRTSSSDAICTALRWPALDANDNDADVFFFSQLAGNTGFHFNSCRDVDVQSSAAWTNSQSDELFPGTYSGGTWPAGTPAFTTSQDNLRFSNFSLPTSVTFDIQFFVNEYIVILIFQPASGTSVLIYEFRSIHAPSFPRKMQFGSRSTVAFPVTFTAPEGAAHLTFTAHETSYNVTFPTGVSLSRFRILQELSLQLRGAIEAHESPLGIAIRHPPAAGPSFSSTLPFQRLACTYIDPTADALNLALYTGNATSVSTTELVVSGINWILFGTRVGGMIYNRTLEAGVTITEVEAGVLSATIPGTWTNMHEYVILPGPESPHSTGHLGGHYLGTRRSVSTAITSADGEVDIVLSDRLGEGRFQFQLDQDVLCHSTGLGVKLVMASVTGYQRHDIVTSSGGAVGRIREIYTSETALVVDTLEGNTTTIGNAWSTSETVTGALGGSSTISSITPSSTGHYQRVRVAAISTMDMPGGDYRTVLTLDFSTISGTTTFTGLLDIGSICRLKLRCSQNYVTAGITAAGPNVHSSTTSILATDVNRNDLLPGSVDNFWDPDYEVGSNQLAEIVHKGSSTNDGRDVWAIVPSLRVINGRATLSVGDFVYEDGDSNRRWKVIAEDGGGVQAGAANSTTSTQHLCIGPGL